MKTIETYQWREGEHEPACFVNSHLRGLRFGFATTESLALGNKDGFERECLTKCSFRRELHRV